MLWLSSLPVSAAEPAALHCSGQARQSGLILCQTLPHAIITISGRNGADRREIVSNAKGIATIGLKRAEQAEIQLSLAGHDASPHILSIAPRSDPFRIIEGLDCDKVDARTPAQKAHAGRSWVKKQAAFKIFSPGTGATQGFIAPATGRMSSPFGPARKYVGVGKDGTPCERTSIHRGYDVAIPVGTDIIAPADGVVTLGDPDLYYEGGTVFLDHGDGLVSVFMHLSAVDVQAGQAVRRGERLGASGNTGRTTGPHLHWAVKWRNPNAEDRGGDFYIDPALLLALTPLVPDQP